MAERLTTTETAPAAPVATGSVLGNGVRLAGEAIAPGASLILSGRVVAGGAHLLAATVAKAILGPWGWLLVAANSYSTATTGKNLLQQAQGEAAALSAK